MIYAWTQSVSKLQEMSLLWLTTNFIDKSAAPWHNSCVRANTLLIIQS